MAVGHRSQLAVLLVLALSLTSCCRSFAKQQDQCGAKPGNESWTAEAWQEARQSLENDASVIFVLDPNFILCWETVPIDAFTNATLLPWIRELKDALTVSRHSAGEDLQVPRPSLSICYIAVDCLSSSSAPSD